MSRFWAANESSSEGEKGSDSDSYDGEPQTQKQAGGKFGATFQESDSESEDEVRVVKSQKDRAWDSMKEGIVRIRNARKNSDWPLIQDEFANVNKMIEKSKMLIIKDGIPNFYIKMLAEVEDHVQLALKDKEGIKKMKAVVSRALNQMKLQVRKHNDNYKNEIADFRANPAKYQDADESGSESSSDDADDSDSDEESGSDDESSEEEITKAPKKTVAKKPAAATGSDSDEDSLFGSGDDDSSDSDSESEGDGRAELKGRAKWLKKSPDAAAAGSKVKVQRVVRKTKEYDTGAATATARQKAAASAWQLEEKMTEEELDKRVAELVASRGRKNTDSRDVLRQLEVLTKAARVHGARKEIPVLMHLMSAMFDSHRNIDDYMELNQWRTAHRSLARITGLLDSHKKLVLGTVASDEVSELLVGAHMKRKEEADGAEDGEGSAAPREDPNRLKVVGSVESFVVRLEDEYTKALQQINPHTKEYVIRLSDEAALVELAESVLAYYHRIKDDRAAANVSLLIVEHLYYKHDSHALAVHRAHAFNKTWGRYSDLHPACAGKTSALVASSSSVKEILECQSATHPASYRGNPTVSPPPFNPGQQLADLCSFIFKFGDERSKTRALLCSVYHHSLHDRYYRARDLFLISHIQDFIDKAEVKTQILYNRTVVTLGLCAFRMGLFQKAHDCLSGICSGRTKELLAQGQMKWGPEKDAEQEKMERRRQIPYHMHINPDLLECCHLTCAMILELPHLARTPVPGAYQTIVSRQFRKYLNGYGKQVFTGPPENTREHVLAATKALLAGEWQKACDYILGLEVWKLLPADGGEKVKAMLRVRIQEEAVRTYLLLNSEHYDSLSLSHICQMFGMEEAVTRRIICRMIFNRELSAAWEHPADILVIYRTELTPLQTLSQSVADKVAQLLESNERLLDPLMGVYGYKDDWNARGGNESNRKWVDKTGGSGGVGKYRNAGYKGAARPAPGGRGAGRGGRGGRGSGGKSAAWGSSSGGGSSGGAGGGTRPAATVGGNPKYNKYQSTTESSQASQPKRWATATA